MDILKNKIQNLLSFVGQNDIEVALQNVLDTFVCFYHLQINGHQVYPTEVEAYYYQNGIFEDACVHRNELQTNHYGQLYVHRAKKNGTKDDKYKGRAGVDVCLSDGSYTFAVLLRGIEVNNEIILGPINVRKMLLKLLGTTDNKILEQQKDILIKEKLETGHTFFSPRIGITSGCVDAELRAVHTDTLIGTNYRKKELLYLGYKRRNIHSDISDARILLGYIPKKLL
ncbi:MAG: hypothetical protein MJZ59_00695 [Paludibacteraceae bacterium]|nr:hypothetical protein [Paludibacteraceae bacterium]